MLRYGLFYPQIELTNVDPDSGDITVTGNHVAGGERGGFRTDGYRCSHDPTWADNHAHSTLNGHVMLPFVVFDGLAPCSVIDGFTTWRNFDFGVYVQNPAKVRIRNIISVENRVGIYALVSGSSSTAHDMRNQDVQVSNVILKGQSAAFDCTNTRIRDDRVLSFSFQGRSYWRPANNDDYK